MKKIILLGYMGSGKTTVAQLLARITGKKYADLDQIIEQQANASIKTIFEQKGELFFRKLEHQVFTDLMASDEAMVIALGGGTPCYADNHKLLNQPDTVSVYLKATIEALYERLVAAQENRPLIAGKTPEEIREFIAKHLFDRSYYYNQAALKISVDGKTPGEIAQEIVAKLA